MDRTCAGCGNILIMREGETVGRFAGRVACSRSCGNTRAARMEASIQNGLSRKCLCCRRPLIKRDDETWTTFRKRTYCDYVCYTDSAAAQLRNQLLLDKKNEGIRKAQGEGRYHDNTMRRWKNGDLHAANVRARGLDDSRKIMRSDDDIRAIRADPRPLCEIGTDYGLTDNSVRFIKKRKTFAHVDGPPSVCSQKKPQGPRLHLTHELLTTILESNKTHQQLGNEIGCSRQTVYQVRKRFSNPKPSKYP